MYERTHIINIIKNRTIKNRSHLPMAPSAYFTLKIIVTVFVYSLYPSLQKLLSEFDS